MTGAPSQVKAPKRLLMTLAVVESDEEDAERWCEAKDKEGFRDNSG
jgi:hypothetical protein